MSWFQFVVQVPGRGQGFSLWSMFQVVVPASVVVTVSGRSPGFSCWSGFQVVVRVSVCGPGFRSWPFSLLSRFTSWSGFQLVVKVSGGDPGFRLRSGLKFRSRYQVSAKISSLV